jgi:ketosteroid isomerase-like protein
LLHGVRGNTDPTEELAKRLRKARRCSGGRGRARHEHDGCDETPACEKHRATISTPVRRVNERTDRITFRGRQLVVPICAVFEVRDGRITAWREYFDPTLFARS